VEKELTGKETEPLELIYFNVYKSQGTTFPRVSIERLQMFQPPILVPREPRIIICVKCLPFCPKYFLLLILGCELCLSKCYALGVDLVSICLTIAFSIFVSACASQLGPFEQRGLQTLWSNGSAAVRELLADGKIRQAYTAMMTTMDRLYKKGLLDRIAEGRAFAILRATLPKNCNGSTALESIRQLLASGDGSVPPLSYLVDGASTHDQQLFDELQLLV